MTASSIHPRLLPESESCFDDDGADLDKLFNFHRIDSQLLTYQTTLQSPYMYVYLAVSQRYKNSLEKFVENGGALGRISKLGEPPMRICQLFPKLAPLCLVNRQKGGMPRHFL